MQSLTAKITLDVLLSPVAFFVASTLVHGQTTFVSSRIDLEYQLQAGGLSARNDAFEPLEGEIDFADSIGDTDTASAGEASTRSAGAFEFTGSLLEASGDTSVEVFNMGEASSSLDFDLTFDVNRRIVFYTANVLLGGSASSLEAGVPQTALRFLDSSGSELFAIDEDTFLDGGQFRSHGVLAPDTYTVQAALATSTGSSDEGNSFMLDAELELSLALRRPELPLVFACGATSTTPIGICMEAIQPTGPVYVATGFVLTAGSAEPIPYSLENIELFIVGGQTFDLGNGPVDADLAIVEAIFDGVDDHFPEDLLDVGTQINTILAFRPGSLTGNERPEDLPLDSLLGGVVQLLDANGNLIAVNQLRLVPEPNSIAILMGLSSLALIGCRRS